MQALLGQRAVVTGASTGIGAATARRLAADGAAVAVNHLHDPGAAEKVIAGIEGRAVAIDADVSVETDVERMFAEAAEALGGPPTLLVNNAGIEKPFALVDMPLEEWELVLRVNLTGAFLCARELARGLLGADEPGTIVNVSSVHEVIPWPRFSHYCASKGAMKLFGQTIAKELAPHGIRVVQVAPGAIDTPINRNLAEDREARQAVLDEVPLGRIGAPDEIAAAIAWLAGPDAAYVTGTTLFVDGGMSTYPKFE